MTIDQRVERDVKKLQLGTIEAKKVEELVRTYYSYGLTDGQNDIVDQEKQIWEWTNGRVRLAEDLK